MSEQDHAQGGKPLTKVEGIKAASDGLAGGIAAALESEATHFEEAEQQLIKFHGFYQEDDRDVRNERKREGLDKAWSFMVRCRIPGGRVTAAQYLALDEIARRWTFGSLRLTSRQAIQFHGVGKENLREVIRAINDSRLTTLGACGDVNRNVMTCPVSDLDERAPLGMQALADRIARHFEAHSTAYWEIWCDGEKLGEKVEPTREEPLYGATYLPRKFKMAIAAPEDNCVDLYTQDVGIEAVHEGGRLAAWDLIVGGGMGFTHGNVETRSILGKRTARVSDEQLLPALEAIVTIQRDHGDRTDRKHARLKYLVEERGVEWLRGQMTERLGFEVAPAGPMPRYQVRDHLGWSAMNDGRLMVGLHIPSGRILDREGQPAMMSTLRAIVERFGPELRLTARQDMVLAGIAPADRPAVEAMLAEGGLRTDAGLPALERLAMACVSLPTCGLALAEAERYMPDLLTDLKAQGILEAPVELRVTGCPNSCVRTRMAEIGLVGRGPGKYAVYLGGSQQGTRLAFLFKEKVDSSEIPGMLGRLVHAWQRATGQGAAFGDWAVATGEEALAGLITEG